ncbi:hypothetical protein [Janthinobacterium kumbetense]|uniref:Uncharacterized protein n=1 Tax=Janthinobacterium kumbetense TaxID=2950280 RepID=A0ABT0WLT8_9BURK|nr:hypothetical protein [Janthinobacterium kumbetense]MCM2564823.1 hypothetical protein [Janthinobacterium kumbetense]
MSYQLIRLSAGFEMRVDIPGRLILVDSVSTGQGVDIALVRNGTPAPYIPGRQAGFRLVEDFGGVLLRSALDCEVGIFLSINDVQLGGTAGGEVVIPTGVAVTNDLAHSIPVTLTSSSNTTPIPVSLASIRVNNTPAQPIPVSFAGTVSPVLGVVKVDNTNAEAIPMLQKPGEVFEVHVNNAVPLPVSVNNTDAQAVFVQPKATAVFTVDDKKRTLIVDAAPVAVGLAATAISSDAAYKRLVIRNDSALAVIALGGAGVTMANAVFFLEPGDVFIENDAPGAAWFGLADVSGGIVQIQGLK